jgi:hypothetical protein
MKLALLGTDPVILRLASAAREKQHEIVWVGDVPTADTEAVGKLTVQSIDRSDVWESLLDGSVADAVLVGRGEATSEMRSEQLKRLTTERVPVLVVHPLFNSVLPYYEIDMVRRETGAVVRHYNPLVGHPVVAELSGWIRSGHPAVGPIHQLSCERRVAEATRLTVLSHLARDLELLAEVAGDVRRVTAIGPMTAEASFASLQVQMSTGEPASLRWSVGSAVTTGPGLQLTFVGEHGTVGVQIPNDNEERANPLWHIETTVNGRQDRQPLDKYDSAGVAIDQLELAISDAKADVRDAISTWPAATRTMEVVDAVELSLQKGRTIEVYQQQLTERLAFRGTMAALGCGLLLVSFLAIIAVTFLGGAEGMIRQRLIPAWPAVLLAVLAFFLLLQAVPLLVQKSHADAKESQQRKH